LDRARCYDQSVTRLPSAFFLTINRGFVLMLGLLLGPVANAEETQPRVPAAPIGTKLAWHVSRAPELLWTGFRMKREGGEVLIQTSAAVELETRATKEGAVFVFKRCRAIRRTDQLPLDTRYFDSPVTRISVKQRAHDLEVSIALRQPVTAIPRKEPGPRGSWFWVFEFPGADAGARTTTAAATP
jgi:hypothetical protein